MRVLVFIHERSGADFETYEYEYRELYGKLLHSFVFRCMELASFLSSPVKRAHGIPAQTHPAPTQANPPKTSQTHCVAGKCSPTEYLLRFYLNFNQIDRCGASPRQTTYKTHKRFAFSMLLSSNVWPFSSLWQCLSQLFDANSPAAINQKTSGYQFFSVTIQTLCVTR